LAPVTTYKQFTAHLSLKNRLRNPVRNGVVFALSLTGSIPRGSNWIQFPFYHHVFDDERRGFEKHLRYMKNFGDFISLDDAVGILESNRPVSGRYFCITFDDGFKNCMTNAMPLLLKYGAPAAFFVPTKYIDFSPDKSGGISGKFFDNEKIVMEFLSWDDCRKMSAEGMAFGSHGVSHTRLIDLSEEEAERELGESKAKIEQELGMPCRHFCAPVGIPGVDFLPDRDPRIAKRVGYQSFVTGRRGSLRRKPDPMLLERHHLVAAWRTGQLRYFLSR